MRGHVLSRYLELPPPTYSGDIIGRQLQDCVCDLRVNDIRIRRYFHGVNSLDPSSCSFWTLHSFPTRRGKHRAVHALFAVSTHEKLFFLLSL